MNHFQEELNKEFDRIRALLEKGETLSKEDMKIILIAKLSEEEMNERNQ